MKKNSGKELLQKLGTLLALVILFFASFGKSAFIYQNY